MVIFNSYVKLPEGKTDNVIIHWMCLTMGCASSYGNLEGKGRFEALNFWVLYFGHAYDRYR